MGCSAVRCVLTRTPLYGVGGRASSYDAWAPVKVGGRASSCDAWVPVKTEARTKTKGKRKSKTKTRTKSKTKINPLPNKKVEGLLRHGHAHG